MFARTYVWSDLEWIWKDKKAPILLFDLAPTSPNLPVNYSIAMANETFFCNYVDAKH